MYQEKQWLKRKIHDISDNLIKVSREYWLSDENDPFNKTRALEIKCNLQDIELYSTKLNVNVTDEIKHLMQYITGGDFENSDRKSISPKDDKFFHISQHICSLKMKTF